MKSRIAIFLLFISCAYLNSQTLLSEYNFTGGSGLDNSGNGNTGTVYGTSTTGNVLVIGSNITDYFRVPAGPLNNKLDFSISFKINFTVLNVSGNFPTNHIFAGDRPGLEGAVGLSYQKDINVWRFTLNGNVYDFSDNSILAGQWYCVTLVREAAGNIKFYIDGVQHPTVYSNSSLTDVTSLILGQETDCTGGCFDANQCTYGMIDDFKIYSGAISQATVNSDCNLCPTPLNPVNATQLSNQVLCAGQAATLSAVGTGTLQWFLSNNSPIVLDTGTSYITPTLTAGNYTFYVAALTCTPSSRTAIEVTVNASPQMTVSQSNSLCPGSVVTKTVSGALSYTWSTGATGNVVNLTPVASTTYSVKGKGANGCESVELFSVTVIDLPQISVNHPTVCIGSTVVLTANATPGAGTDFTWNPGSQSGSTISVSPAASRSYTLLVNAGGCYTQQTTFVTVTDSANAITSYSYPPVCENTGKLDPVLADDFTLGGFFSSTQLNVDSAMGFLNLSSLSAGIYTVNYSYSAKNCIRPALSPAQVIIQAVPKLQSSGNVTIEEESSITLTVSGGMNYKWEPSAHLSCDTCPDPVASPPQTTKFCVSSTLNSCSSQTCFTVFVGCENPGDLSVPNAFTPNGDGLNDEFCLQGWDQCITNFTIIIFNRWGEKVFESDKPDFCWDGFYKGKLLSTEVFVYVIKAVQKKSTITKKGNISLIR